MKKNLENPFRILDEIFNASRNQTKDAFISEHHKGNMPRVNIIDNDKKFIIEMTVPGLEKKDITIKIEQNILSIQSNKELQNRNYTHYEYCYDSFERKFQLSDEINTDNISAEFKNGLLIIDVPKKENEIIKNKEIKIS